MHYNLIASFPILAQVSFLPNMFHADLCQLFLLSPHKGITLGFLLFQYTFQQLRNSLDITVSVDPDLTISPHFPSPFLASVNVATCRNGNSLCLPLTVFNLAARMIPGSSVRLCYFIANNCKRFHPRSQYRPHHLSSANVLSLPSCLEPVHHSAHSVPSPAVLIPPLATPGHSASPFQVFAQCHFLFRIELPLLLSHYSSRLFYFSSQC